MTALPHMVSYLDKEFSISLEVPDGWGKATTADFPLVFLAPLEDNYRSNLGFSKTAVDLPTPQQFEQEIAKVKAQQLVDYPQFQEIEERKFWVDNRPAYWQQYEWQDKGYHFVQILAILVISPTLVYEVNGSTLKPVAERYLPIFSHMINSIRYHDL